MRVIIVCAAILMAGCISPQEQDQVVWDDEPIRLLATSSFMAHRGSGSVTTIPESEMPEPASCILFREDTAHSEDSCTVLEGPHSYHPKDDNSQWHIRGSFNGSGYPLDDPRRWDEKSIIAYDSIGQVMGMWDGATDYHREHMRAIE